MLMWHDQTLVLFELLSKFVVSWGQDQLTLSLIQVDFTPTS